MPDDNTTQPCALTYNRGDLGDQVFTFATEQQARDFLYKRNPPDLLVRSAYLDVAGCRHIVLNPFFWPAGYDHAVAADKNWRDGYYRRTGRVWNGPSTEGSGDGGNGDGNHKLESNLEGEDLDYDACLRLLGLQTGFTPTELTKAYRAAIKLNHPDKVAAMATEFKVLAERRSRMINQAYEKLRGG